MPLNPRHLLYAGFAGWLLLTASSQLPWRELDPRLPRRLDPHGLLFGDFRFFAPMPMVIDYHLLYRDQLHDGTLTEWTELPIAHERRLLDAIWCPRLRVDKAFIDAFNGIVAITPLLDDHTQVQFSIYYISLLNYVTAKADHAPGAYMTQFLVAASEGRDVARPPEFRFLSEFHRLA